MTFDIMDSRDEIRTEIEPGYFVVARRESSHGWDIGLYRRPSSDSKELG